MYIGILVFRDAVGEFGALAEEAGKVSPDSLEELTKETDDEDALLQGDYIDPWGTEIKYDKPKKGGKRPLLTSAGEDKEFGTPDDITNKDNGHQQGQ